LIEGVTFAALLPLLLLVLPVCPLFFAGVCFGFCFFFLFLILVALLKRTQDRLLCAVGPVVAVPVVRPVLLFVSWRRARRRPVTFRLLCYRRTRRRWRGALRSPSGAV
jgi:hypothetical protein